jgi:hypothetical protein
MAVYEGLWDCTSCGAKGIRGAERSCKGCGAPRADDVKFYLPQQGQAAVVTDAAKVAEAKAGEDWYCEHCSGGNKAVEALCRQCGAPRGSSKGHGAAKAAEKARDQRPPMALGATGTPAAAAPLGAGGKLVMFLILMLIVSCCCCTAWMGRARDVTATVAAREWERTQAIESFGAVREEGWTAPAGARIVRSERRVHHHDKVLDHHERRTRQVQVQTGTRSVKVGTRDMGNGYFEDVYEDQPVYGTRSEEYQEPIYRDVPVYEQYHVWDIDKWAVSRTDRANGVDDEPRWPQPSLRQGERLGAKTARYTLRLREQEGAERTAEVDEALWRSFTTGQQVTITVSGSEVRAVRAAGGGG